MIISLNLSFFHKWYDRFSQFLKKNYMHCAFVQLFLKNISIFPNFFNTPYDFFLLTCSHKIYVQICWFQFFRFCWSSTNKFFHSGKYFFLTSHTVKGGLWINLLKFTGIIKFCTLVVKTKENHSGSFLFTTERFFGNWIALHSKACM